MVLLSKLTVTPPAVGMDMALAGYRYLSVIRFGCTGNDTTRNFLNSNELSFDRQGTFLREQLSFPNHQFLDQARLPLQTGEKRKIPVMAKSAFDIDQRSGFVIDIFSSFCLNRWQGGDWKGKPGACCPRFQGKVKW